MEHSLFTSIVVATIASGTPLVIAIAIRMRDEGVLIIEPPLQLVRSAREYGTLHRSRQLLAP